MQEKTGFTTGRGGNSTKEVVPGVAYTTAVFANVYFVDAVADGERAWALVDTGLSGFAGRIRQAAEERYGQGTRPRAILLTHGHFDHAGSALDLSKHWDVPIYAHRLEMPYLTGKSDYPPQDPTVGGALAFLSRFFPHSGYDFKDRVQLLPEDGSVPGLPGWRAIHTPGHTAGHAAFFDEGKRVLLAGDALATENQDSWIGMMTHKQELRRPPAPFTTDWVSARRSIEMLAELNPLAISAGHGIPMTGAGVAEKLRNFAANFSPPRKGRYVNSPARADESGVVELPPPVSDPLPKVAAGLGVAALAGAAVMVSMRGRKKAKKRRGGS
ncbi:MAG: MBL fold metallo-hydrolase [Acidobacteria bacterium]|nr:MBL fold metallo-hydrolase [Acidobacteriota bacterium]